MWVVIWEDVVPGGALKPKFYWPTQTMVTAGILPFRKNSHGRAGNRTRDLMISSQRLWPLDHEAYRNIYTFNCEGCVWGSVHISLCSDSTRIRKYRRRKISDRSYAVGAGILLSITHQYVKVTEDLHHADAIVGPLYMYLHRRHMAGRAARYKNVCYSI